MASRKKKQKLLKKQRRKYRLLQFGHTAGLLLGILCGILSIHNSDALPFSLFYISSAFSFTCLSISLWCYYFLARDHELWEFSGPGDLLWNAHLHRWRRVDPKSHRFLAIFLTVFSAGVWLLGTIILFVSLSESL